MSFTEWVSSLILRLLIVSRLPVLREPGANAIRSNTNGLRPQPREVVYTNVRALEDA